LGNRMAKTTPSGSCTKGYRNKRVQLHQTSWDQGKGRHKTIERKKQGEEKREKMGEPLTGQPGRVSKSSLFCRYKGKAKRGEDSTTRRKKKKNFSKGSVVTWETKRPTVLDNETTIKKKSKKQDKNHKETDGNNMRGGGKGPLKDEGGRRRDHCKRLKLEKKELTEIKKTYGSNEDEAQKNPIPLELPPKEGIKKL